MADWDDPDDAGYEDADYSYDDPNKQQSTVQEEHIKKVILMSKM